jgi:hypothetical protein
MSPHLVIPVKARGVVDDETRVDADLSLQISFRALLLIGIMLNLISAPLLTLLEHYAT